MPSQLGWALQINVPTPVSGFFFFGLASHGMTRFVFYHVASVWLLCPPNRLQATQEGKLLT